MVSIKSRYSIWYRPRKSKHWRCLRDDLTVKNAYECVDSLRKCNIDCYVVVGN